MKVNKAADKHKQQTVRSLKKKTANIEFCCGWGTSKFGYERSSDDLLTEFVWSRTIRLRRIDQVLDRMKTAGPPNSPPARSLDRPRPAPPLSFSPIKRCWANLYSTGFHCAEVAARSHLDCSFCPAQATS